MLTGNRGTGLPLLDCVADMQVIYRIDSNNDGTIDVATDNLATLTDTNSNGIIDAQQIRDQVKEVRVYILAHEGQRDVNYDATTTYPGNQITIPPRPLTPVLAWKYFRFCCYWYYQLAKLQVEGIYNSCETK